MAQQNGIVDVQRKNIGCKVQKHCTYIRAFIYKKKEHKSMIEKKKVHTEQTKKYILVTVSYFIILFWLIRNWHLNNCEICCVSIIIYIKEKKSTNGRPKIKKKKIVTIVAIVPPGTVATVQN